MMLVKLNYFGYLDKIHFAIPYDEYGFYSIINLRGEKLGLLRKDGMSVIADSNTWLCEFLESLHASR